jgi:7,8-dihydropterin-6-yl-methyl-4-(beta-D-ribofuranosyl)aminobenzene 5'-phosphate synthase
MDEMGLVAAARDVGLVIITGCAHAGVIHTIAYVRPGVGTVLQFAR